MQRIQVIVAAGSADYKKIRDSLSAIGMKIDKVVEEYGIIRGHLAETKFAEVLGVEGILFLDQKPSDFEFHSV